MDKSETYIKMCEKAEEIQEQKKGHVMQSLHFDEHIDKVMGVWITRRGEYYTGYSLGLENEVVIWLPRQDQLQEMVGGYGWSGQLSKLDRWIQEIPFTQLELLDTWGQLWFAFVMKEKYNKVWDGEDWVK